MLDLNITIKSTVVQGGVGGAILKDAADQLIVSQCNEIPCRIIIFTYIYVCMYEVSMNSTDNSSLSKNQ